MCGCWCPDEIKVDEEIDDAIREVDEEDEAIDVTEEFAIPVRIDEEVEVE